MMIETAVTGSAVIIGIVNGVRLLQEASLTKNYWGFILFVIALITGTLLGALGLYGLNLETGLALGAGSSGVYRFGELVGGVKK